MHTLIAAEFQYIKTKWRNSRTWRGRKKTRNKLTNQIGIMSRNLGLAKRLSHTLMIFSKKKKKVLQHLRRIRKKKLQTKRISFVMSVRPSLWLFACKNSATLNRFSWSTIFRTVHWTSLKIGKITGALFSALQVQFAHTVSARTMTDVDQLRTLFVISLQVLEINKRKSVHARKWFD